MIRDDHRKPLAHYGAPQGRARSRLAPPSYTTSRDATQLDAILPGHRSNDFIEYNVYGFFHHTVGR